MRTNWWQLCLAIQLAIFGLLWQENPLLATVAGDFERLNELFQKASQKGATVTIPPGDYHLSGEQPIELHSDLNVIAQGARFHFPDSLPDKSRLVLFAGQDIRNLTWQGGHFEGYVFDPQRADSRWAPSANTRGIVITTSGGGETENLVFRDITSQGVAGAVVTVMGASKAGSDRDIETYARNITVENCTLLNSGKFMWDYGYLWQITVWPEEFSEQERAVAARYFRNDLIRGPLRMSKGDDRIYLNNTQPLPISIHRSGSDSERGNDTICFFGDRLPSNVVRGRQYYVIDSQSQFIRIADSVGGTPIKFASDAGPNARLISNLFQAYWALYAPTGSGPGKGAFDLVGCSRVTVRGCHLSAMGDTMHIQKSQNIIFSNNHIIGSRMGAFFLAEYCKNAIVTGNTVDGTNGSRVVSVEKSCEDVVISANTFRNGGRGSWINQPRNFLLADNIFVNNTTKCQPNPKTGRRSFLTGQYERYAELYFTTYEAGGKYSNVVVRGNTFVSGPKAAYAMTFAPGGNLLRVEENIFDGPVRTMPTPSGCENLVLRDNTGLITGNPQLRLERASPVLEMPGLVAFWDFVNREPTGDHRFIAHVPVGARNNFPLDAGNYVREYWNSGQPASYDDFPLLGRGPFGQAIRIKQESDADFRPYLFVPRARIQDSPLDIKGANKSVSLIVWAIRESGNHALAGIWHEGTDLKQNDSSSPVKVTTGQRQYALFAGLNRPGSACGHVSENGAGSFLNRYALHKSNSLAQAPEIPGDAPEQLLDSSWQCFAMTFDNRTDELTGWLNGAAGDRWLDNPKDDRLISSAHNAYMQGYFAKMPGKQSGEDEAFPKDQYYNPPEGQPLAMKVVSESAEERVELREHRYTKVQVKLVKNSAGKWEEQSRELVALRLNPWWYPHGIYAPTDPAAGGPFTIGRVIHSSRGVGFTGWIGGVAVFDRALTAAEIAQLARLSQLKPVPAD